MRLTDLLPDPADVVALPPEELAIVILQWLNHEAVDNQDKLRDDPPFWHIHDVVRGVGDDYKKIGGRKCEHALSAAFQHLITTGMLAPHPYQNLGFYFLTPRARSLRNKDDFDHFRKTALYPRGQIHQIIEEETFPEFLRGDYETAVFKAYKAIEIAVRPHTTAPQHVVGRDLMVKAFHSETGTLRDATEVAAERESLMELFRGAVGRFKNPTSHREVNFDDAAEVVEILQLASLLMRLIDRRKAAISMPGM